MAVSYSVRLCGPPMFACGGLEVRPLRHKTIALVAFLIAEARPKSRDTLSTLLWPSSGQAAARTNLRTAIHDAAGILPPSMLSAGLDRVELLQCSDVWVDFWEVTRYLDNDCEATIERLSEVQQLIRGEFLEGFSLADCSEFDLWQLQTAEELRRRQVQILTRLATKRLEIGAVSEAIDDVARLVALDPLEEASHRLAIEVYARSGRWATALEQFEVCRMVLRDELGVEPEAETVRLAEEVRRHEARLVRPGDRMVAAERGGIRSPVPSTRLFGRERELDALKTLLGSGHRLVTIVGPAGVGKTRLALEAAARGCSFPGGIAFGDLTETRTPADVPRIIAAAVGIRQRVVEDEEILRAIAEHLTGRRMLLLLDNFEHVIAAAASLAKLVEGSRAAQFLVTSREPLHLSGESILRLSPLAVPPPGARAEIAQCAAVQLFMDRVQNQFPELGGAIDDIDSIRRICEELEGLPLALELAVPLLHVYSLKELPRHLSRADVRLAGGFRDLPKRHRSLEDAIEWSYSLLQPEERHTIGLLSVCANGFDLDAAVSVCGLNDDQTLRSIIAGLVDKSLLQIASEEPSRRFSFLESTRDFVAGKFNKTGELQQASARHAKHYRGLVLKARGELHGPAQIRWMKIIDAAHPNILQALESMVARGHFVEGLETATALEWYWYRRGLYQLGAEQIRRFLERTPILHSSLRASALHALGWLTFISGDWRTAHYLYAQSLHLSRRVDNRLCEQLSLSDLGVVKRWLGDTESGTSYALAAVEAARTGGTKHSLARALVWAYATTGGEFRDEYPLSELEEAVELAEKTGDPWLVAHAHNGIGDLLCERRHYVEARAHYTIALRGFMELDDRYLAAWTAEGMGRVEAKSGNLSLALLRISEALTLFDSLGDDLNVALMISRAVGHLAGMVPDSRRAVLAGAASALVNARSSEDLANTPQVNEAQRLLSGLRRSCSVQWFEGRTLARATAVAMTRELIRSAGSEPLCPENPSHPPGRM